MRKLAGILAVVSVLAAILGSSAPARVAGPVNWSQFRFNQHHTGVNPFETTITPSNITSVTLHWQDQLGELVDFSSPAVVNGVAYIGSSDGRLWAFAAGGCGRSLCTTARWKSTDLGQIRDSPTVSGGIVYVGSQTSNTVAAAIGAIRKTTVLVPLPSPHQPSTPDTAGRTVLTGQHVALPASQSCGSPCLPDHCDWPRRRVRSAAGQADRAPG